MFICLLQRRDSPSVVVTVKNSTNAAAAGHVVAGSGGVCLGTAEIRPDHSRAHRVRLGLCQSLSSRWSRFSGGSRFALNPLLRQWLQFSPLWVPPIDVQKHTHTEGHFVGVEAFYEKRPSTASSLQEKKRAAEGRDRRGRCAGLLPLSGHLLSARGRQVTAWHLSEVQWVLRRAHQDTWEPN